MDNRQWIILGKRITEFDQCGHPHKRYLWFEEVTHKDLPVTNDVVLLNMKAQVLVNHPHYDWEFKDVTREYLEAK